TGASGLIGSALARRLEGEGHAVLHLVRREARGPGEARWDPAAGTIDAAALEGLDALVHLAGENIGVRWTAERKRAFRVSRVDGTRLLAGTVAKLARKPGAFVMASAIGIYGERGDERLDEMSAPGSGFLAELVRDWEAAAHPAADAGVRVAQLRFGVVFSGRGGALERLLPPFRLGVGGVIGSGRQWMGWLSLDDAVDLLLFAIRDARVSGPVNAVAGSVTNAEFTRTLAKVLNRPAFVPVPAFGLRLLFGEMADQTILVSQRVLPRRLTQLGYSFRHPEVEGALRAALAEDG
ncbi:MAG TPA: TIGR01777 family oxidoreductase, partial [Longimicrobium sp.]|nr:TIGR01777 family oxidoreductase [Longimicrobium sp.]